MYKRYITTRFVTRVTRWVQHVKQELHFARSEFIIGIQWGSRGPIFSFLCNALQITVFSFVFFLLVIALSVLPRFIISDYLSDIFQRFFISSFLYVSCVKTSLLTSYEIRHAHLFRQPPAFPILSGDVCFAFTFLKPFIQ